MRSRGRKHKHERVTSSHLKYVTNEVLDQTEFENGEVIITRHLRESGVIVNPAEWRRLKALDRVKSDEEEEEEVQTAA